MTKSFKIARKPGQAKPAALEQERGEAREQSSTPVTFMRPQATATTRKTIEVPEEYFYQVKMRALQRRMKEKDLWAEIVSEYFKNHPKL